MYQFKANGGFGMMHQATKRRVDEGAKKIDIETVRGNATEKEAIALIEKAIKKLGVIRVGDTYREKDLEVIFQDSSSGKMSSKIWTVVINKDSLAGPWALAKVSY